MKSKFDSAYEKIMQEHCRFKVAIPVAIIENKDGGKMVKCKDMFVTKDEYEKLAGTDTEVNDSTHKEK